MNSANAQLTPLEIVFDYHERTKHHFSRFAASLGYLDWVNQPDPFRRFEGAPFVSLRQMTPNEGTSYDALFIPEKQPPPVLLSIESASRLFYDSLSLSAWKAIPGTRWSLRVNPSSGNLHPTEGYLICGPMKGLSETPGVWHYTPLQHGLELRRVLTQDLWDCLCKGSGYDCFIALSSIHWRESWKYGERAYRYCQHDVGHAVAAVAMASGVLGWHCDLIETCSDEDLATLLGLDQQSGIEAEHPDCLLGMVISPTNAPNTTWSPGSVAGDAGLLPLFGEVNRLSRQHHAWPVIDNVAEACSKPVIDQPVPPAPSRPVVFTQTRKIDARQLIRQRRSAVDMDGKTSISRATFYGMLSHVLPTNGHPVWGAWPWPASVNLALFVHRVSGLARGLYWLQRTDEADKKLRTAMRSDFVWSRSEHCPAELPLWLLMEGDFGKAANLICCQQAIAQDGAFALAMVARFAPRLAAFGPWFYRRLFWETGMLGQILYLEAEAAGIRSTGIGCFFDDVLHETLGLTGHEHQSLYHFTVGGPVEDTRLQTLEPYFHLKTVYHQGKR